MLFAFTASLPQVSKLNSIDFREGRQWQTRGWTIHRFWVPVGFLERNAWESFAARFAKLVKGKSIINDGLQRIKPTNDAHELASSDKNVLLREGSATILDGIPDNSVDYIFTDPPYGSSIPYLGLSLFWSSWLRKGLDFDKEIGISERGAPDKELARYKDRLKTSFIEMYRVLKPNGWMSLTFHNRNISIWNALVSAAQEAHFEYVNDNYQVPAVISAKAQTQREGSMTGDIIITFRKPADRPPRLMVNQLDAERLIVSEARQIIIERGGIASRDQLMRGIVSILMKAGALDQFRQEGIIDYILNKNFAQANSNQWKLRGEEKRDLISYIPLGRRIEWIIQSVLNRGSATLDDILVAIFTNLKNGRTPENQEIYAVLKRIEYFQNGKWCLESPIQLDLLSWDISRPKLAQAEVSREEEATHNSMISILARLGHQARYLCHVGTNEMVKSKELFELSDIKELSIPGVSRKIIKANRIDQIDLIWLKGRNIPMCLFEVGNSTRVTTCIPRLSNLMQLLPHLNSKVYIVVQDFLEEKVKRELSTTSSKALMGEKSRLWRYVLYTDLLRLSDPILPLRLPLDPAIIDSVSRPA
jgi:hypothetical protein